LSSVFMALRSNCEEVGRAAGGCAC
jgi:hypothetical protein